MTSISKVKTFWDLVQADYSALVSRLHKLQALEEPSNVQVAVMIALEAFHTGLNVVIPDVIDVRDLNSPLELVSSALELAAMVAQSATLSKIKHDKVLEFIKCKADDASTLVTYGEIVTFNRTVIKWLNFWLD